MDKQSEKIKKEIEAKFGFFPPFFGPALETPRVLESLWRQTLTDYVENPLPHLFKEKLAAMLARYCTVPYCLMCHSSSLRPLGMKPGEVLDLLERAPSNYEDLSKEMNALEADRISGWPEENSESENAILACCIAIFLNQDADLCQRKLKLALEPAYFQYLTIFISYNKMALNWAEMHPELVYQDDHRVKNHLAPLIEGEPRLADFFANYQGRLLAQTGRKNQWLTTENKRILEEERKRLNSYFSQAPVGFAVVEEPEHRFVMANAKYEELVGSTNFQGKGIRDVLDKEQYPKFFDALDSAYSSGKGFVERERLVKVRSLKSSEVSEVFVSITVEPYKNEDGRIAGLFIVLNDVTEQVQARKKIETSERELATERQNWLSLFDEASGFVTIISMPDLVYEYSNPAHRRIFDRDPVGKKVAEFMTDETLNPLLEMFSGIYKTGRAVHISEFGLKIKGEHRYFDGTYAPRRNKSGAITGIVAWGIDITSQILIRNALQVSESSFKSITEATPQVVWTADPEGSVTFANSHWYSYTGLTEEQTLGVGFASIIHPEDVANTFQKYGESLKTLKPLEIEHRFRRGVDGTYRWFLTRAVPSLDEKGQPIKWFGTNIDIHDQKLFAEELKEAKAEADRANNSKSAFLANMSHEIRSPLGSIMGFSDLLKSTDLSREDVNQYISVIDRNSHHLLRIIDDILDLAKVEAGKMLIERVEFSLHELLADFSSLMGFRARDKGIEFQLRVPGLIPSAIVSDPTRLRQILTNVVGNAIKFTERGNVQLLVTFDSIHVQFIVSDTGPGIAPDQAEKLFQPFQQADVSTTRKFGGTGLGLVLTRRLSEALGGTFKLVRSAVDQGSTFVATIRAEVPGSATMIDSSKDLGYIEEPKVGSKSQARPLAGLHVLVVDDSPDNQVLFQLMLTRAGATIDIAVDGFDGVNLALTKSYDVILMDVQMPRMDGHQAAQELRSKGYRVPIIALTAHAMNEEKERAAKSGFTGFLSKPVHRDELMDLLKQFVK